jgi:hypothetical protein
MWGSCQQENPAPPDCELDLPSDSLSTCIANQRIFQHLRNLFSSTEHAGLKIETSSLEAACKGIRSHEIVEARQADVIQPIGKQGSVRFDIALLI